MSDTEAKTKDASKRKLDKQRKDGNIAQSSELSSLFSSGVAMVVFSLTLPLVLNQIEQIFASAFESMQFEFADAVNVSFMEIGAQTALVVVPFVALVSSIAILSSVLYNGGIVFSLKPIAPQLQRLSITGGFKRIFGRRGWIEFFQTLTRISIWLVCGVLAVWSFFHAMFRLDGCGITCIVDLVASLGWTLVILALLVMLVAAGIDMIVQRNIYLHEQRMTKTEDKQEQNEQFGSKEIRRERNRIRKESVNSADAVGVSQGNMCIYFEERCIVIRFHPDSAPVPRITAKGNKKAESDAIRTEMAAKGFPETASEAIVAGGKTTAPGDPLKEELYDAFVAALQEMYGR